MAKAQINQVAAKATCLFNREPITVTRSIA
ncbi:Uncharacterised protein [Vibrio cholerae]|nr:Uncharacterised protein [Vibrio cholerae]